LCQLKKQAGEMASWQKSKLMKCQVHEIVSWWNAILTKKQANKMTIWWNVLAPRGQSKDQQKMTKVQKLKIVKKCWVKKNAERQKNIGWH
jgi:hypothetical protein